MKTTNTLFALTLILFFSACEHKLSVETTVNEDGSIDKMFSFINNDSLNGESIKKFGISEKGGWTKVISVVNDSLDGDSNQLQLPGKARQESAYEKLYQTTYTKIFPSAKEVNEALDIYSDTTIQITTQLEKKFRWFYTYMYYSETYHPINKLHLPIEDYITPEDSAFIERLPAEGKKISKADSLQLTALNDKLFEKYGTAAITAEYFEIMVGLMRAQKLDKRWEDTLHLYQEKLFERMMKEQNIEADYLPNKMDSIGIPLDYTIAKKDFAIKSKELEKKLEFIAWASDGKYNNVVNMPWEVVHTNADSISGNRLFWNPPVMKFLFKKHTLYAESRKMNYWAVGVSALFVIFTIVLFIRKKKN